MVSNIKSVSLHKSNVNCKSCYKNSISGGGDMQKVSSGEKNKNKKKQHSAAYSVSSLQKMLGTFFTYLV